jgi:hypothetical protein
MQERTETEAKEESVRRDTSSRYRAQTPHAGRPQKRFLMKGIKKVRQKKYPIMFTLRATKGEHERLVTRAKEAQLSLSRFLIECGLTKDAPTWEDRQQRERAIIQLIRTGNNLNQIAKQLNAQRGTVDYANLEQTMKTLRAMLQQIDTLCHQQKPNQHSGDELRQG